MKLYTEEQVRIAIDKARDYYDGFVFTEEEVIEKLTPIELPSDEEIEQYSIGYALVNEDVSDKLDNYLVSAIHIDGAMWFKKQILNQNK